MSLKHCTRLKAAALLLFFGCGEEAPSLAQVEPGIDVSIRRINFPKTAMGRRVTEEVTVQNIGQGVLTIDSIRIEGSMAFSVKPNELFKLEGGRSRTLDVTFFPEETGLIAEKYWYF